MDRTLLKRDARERMRRYQPNPIVIGLIVWAVLFATRKRRKAKREKKLAEKEMIEDLKRRAREEREKQEQS